MAGRYELPVISPHRGPKARTYHQHLRHSRKGRRRGGLPAEHLRRHRRDRGLPTGGLLARSLLAVFLGVVLVLALIWPGPRREQADEAVRSGPTIRLWDHSSRQLLEMPLEEYLLGVVAAEMPANMPLEALKAQAVAARTLALRALYSGARVVEEPRANLSSDYRAGQAWKSTAVLRKQWGILLYQWNMYRIRKAVQATAGIVLTYNGQLIFPAFHSTSGGMTENSENYWSEALPYLRSVISPHEDRSPYREQVVRLSPADVRARLAAVATAPSGLSTHPGSESGRQNSQIRVISRYPSGRVNLFEFEGRVYTGRQVREALNLPSSWFYVTVEGGQLTFRVKGYGHGVGLSQYGAAGMAERGSKYQEILAHYYQGTTLARAY
ncbi:MAG: stage II sporulation protein D [Limnochordales bacterium]|nr:stage II sporulation protein D [Limnochordales bacterium]